MRSGIGGQSSWVCIRQHGGEAEDEDDVRDIGKHDFRSDLLRPMLSTSWCHEVYEETADLFVTNVVVIQHVDDGLT